MSVPSLFASVRTGSSPFPGGHGALSVLTASNCSTRPATSLEQARAPLDPLAACQPTLQMGAYARHRDWRVQLAAPIWVGPPNGE